MTWARLDDRLHQNPKLAQLPDHAFRLYIHGISFASAHGTDGVLLRSSLPLIWPSAPSQRRVAAADLLVKHGCWHLVEWGWAIHDFLEYNPTAEKAEAKRASRSASGSYGNHQRWHVGRGVTDPDCEHCNQADRKGDRKGDRGRESQTDRSRARPVPSRKGRPSSLNEDEGGDGAAPVRSQGGARRYPPDDPRHGHYPGQRWSKGEMDFHWTPGGQLLCKNKKLRGGWIPWDEEEEVPA